MAFVIDPAQQNTATAQVPGQAPVAAGGAGLAGGTTKGAANTPGKNIPAQPSAQLSAYLNANQTQASNLAGQVAGQVGTQINAAGNAIQPAVNVYTGQQYTVPTDATVNNQVATAPSQLTPGQTATYQQELGASAAAPNSAATFEASPGYQSLAQGVQQSVEQANLWNSGNNPANLSTALQPYEAPTATQGDATLDALLLSQTPGAYSQIQNAVAPAANLPGQLTAGTAQADQALQGAIAQDNAATAAATAAPQTFSTNLTTYLNNAINQATQGDTTASNQILQDLSTNTPSRQDLQILGVTPTQWDTLSGEMNVARNAGVPINLSQYLTQTQPNVNAANIATPQNYSDVAAIQSLLGANAPVEPIAGTTASEAGTAPTEAQLNQLNTLMAEQAAQTAPLVKEEQGIESGIANAESQYGINHFGGQTPDQFAAYINGLTGELGSLNQQIAAIEAQKVAS